MLIYVNLQYRDQLPGFMSSDDLLQAEDKIFSTMVVSYSFNYNSYLTTTIIMPPLFLLSYYFQLTKQVEFWHDPYQHSGFESEEEANEYIMSRMVLTTVTLFFLQGSFYLK